MTASSSISPRRIAAARKRISETIQPTPMVESSALSEKCRVPIFLKLEHLQITGSFKLRGATNAILRLTTKQRDQGVVGVSTGNHGRGLAHAAQKNGVRCIICMSHLVPQNKVDAIRALGAEVRILGQSQDDAQIEVDRLVAEEGMNMIPPFDHADIIAGQGTLGLEIVEAIPNVSTVLIQVSGGGLISGVAIALRHHNPDIRIIGVSMERGAAMYQSQKAGKPILVEEKPTLADSLGGGIGLNNTYTFATTRDLVDEIVLVSELEIADAIRHAYWRESQIVEGSGAVTMAALLSGKVQPEGTTVALVSGGNIDTSLHRQVISGTNTEVSGINQPRI